MLRDEWIRVLPENAIEAAKKAMDHANSERHAGKLIYPAEESVFRALNVLAPQDVRAVILGQDPYHEVGQAHGLAFSVPEGTKAPPSLRNIFKELQEDTGDVRTRTDLSDWCAQGVLLLNTVLTVEDGKANSHRDFGWQRFTTAVIRYCLESTDCVFLCWGKPALDTVARAGGVKDIAQLQLGDRLLCSTHPSPLSANNRKSALQSFMGSRPFSRINTLLVKKGRLPIRWN